MARALFLAGATGVIGRRLTPLLVADGWRVTGMTRSHEKAAALRAIGAEAVIVDAFDATSLIAAVAQIKPDVVVHQLTDLPSGLDPAKMVEATGRNARIRDEGTRNLVDAATRAGAHRRIEAIFNLGSPGVRANLTSASLRRSRPVPARTLAQVRVLIDVHVGYRSEVAPQHRVLAARDNDASYFQTCSVFLPWRANLRHSSNENTAASAATLNPTSTG